MSKECRRDVLIIGAKGLLAARFVHFAGLIKIRSNNNEPLDERITRVTSPEYGYRPIELTHREKVLLNGLMHVPDIQTPIFTDAQGQLRGFVTAGQSSYMVLINRVNGNVILQDPIRSVIGPDRSRLYRNGYTGISSVVQPDTANPNLLLATLDCEQHASDGRGGLVWWQFTGRVALARSIDGGRTWNDQGVIIRGYDPIYPGTPAPLANNEIRPTGAIHPWALPVRVGGQNYLYIYYTDLTSNIKRPNQICLSRCTVDESGNLGQQELLVQSGRFVVNGEKQGLEPKGVFRIPENGIYTAIPSVYYYQDHFLGIFESNIGFYMANSLDGVNWSNPGRIFEFPIPIINARANGGELYSNPTLFSPDQSNNHRLSKIGYLLFSYGILPGSANRYPNIPHEMERMKFDLK